MFRLTLNGFLLWICQDRGQLALLDPNSSAVSQDKDCGL